MLIQQNRAPTAFGGLQVEDSSTPSLAIVMRVCLIDVVGDPSRGLPPMVTVKMPCASCRPDHGPYAHTSGGVQSRSLVPVAKFMGWSHECLQVAPL